MKKHKMKKIYFYIITIIILIIILITGIKKTQSHTSIRLDKRNFSIDDTLSITKIILENRNLEKIQLKRSNDHKNWTLNDSLIANQYLINLLLKTLKEMRIKKPIARSALENVIKRMAIQNTKITIFKNNNKIESIYVGGETADQLGTFMMLENAKEPYVIHIPGFNGYLSSRFSCKENNWISKQIFPHSLLNASYIFQSNDYFDTINISNPSKLNSIYCEDFLSSHKEFDSEEIIARNPFCVIEVMNRNKDYSYLYCIRKKTVKKEKYKNQKYDQERFYGYKNGHLMLIQYTQFENMILSESMRKIFKPWEI